MAKRKKVTVVLLNLNGKTLTLDCLQSLRELRQAAVQVRTIVVDNGSTDDSVSAIQKQFPKVTVIANHQNLGFCGGNNLGVRTAIQQGAQYVLILNNDTVVHPLLVENLLSTANEHNAQILSPKIYFAAGYEFHKHRYRENQRGRVIWYAGGIIDWANVLPSHRGVDELDHGQYNRVEETEFVTGCATFLTRQVYEAIGLYDPVYFAYFEDADFSIRARRVGLRLLYAPSAYLWHKNAASFGGSGSPFQDYFITRNRVIFGLRYAPLRTKVALLRESTRFLINGPARKRRAVLDALSRRLPPLTSIR